MQPACESCARIETRYTHHAFRHVLAYRFITVILPIVLYGYEPKHVILTERGAGGLGKTRRYKNIRI